MIMERFQNLDCAKGDVAPMLACDHWTIAGGGVPSVHTYSLGMYLGPGMVWGFRFPEWSRRGFLPEVPCIFHIVGHHLAMYE